MSSLRCPTVFPTEPAFTLPFLSPSICQHRPECWSLSLTHVLPSCPLSYQVLAISLSKCLSYLSISLHLFGSGRPPLSLNLFCQPVTLFPCFHSCLFKSIMLTAYKNSLKNTYLITLLPWLRPAHCSLHTTYFRTWPSGPCCSHLLVTFSATVVHFSPSTPWPQGSYCCFPNSQCPLCGNLTLRVLSFAFFVFSFAFIHVYFFFPLITLSLRIF